MNEQNTKTKLLNFSGFLQKRLSSELPGHVSHLKMTPLVGSKPFRGFKPTPDAKSSAVMLLLTEINDDINVLLTLRSKSLNSHSGQISFPGGRIEGDETFIEAAFRETFEEIHIHNNKIELIGALSPLFVPPSNSIIYPFVASFIYENVEIKINPDEVDEVFFVPLMNLLKPELKKTEVWNFKGIDVEVPFWNVHESTPLWGATAMILSEFLIISNDFLRQNN